MVLKNLGNFGITAIKTIDEIRSTKADLNKPFGNSAKKTESRISAFYRALGLPAIATKAKLHDPLNSGNLHVFDLNTVSKSTKKTVNEIRFNLISREVDFDAEIDEDEVDKFLDVNKSTILGSVNPTDKNQDLSRTRGTLFPMFVDGEMSIMPQGSRIAGAFFSEDQRIDNVLYRRPLIELIVLLRLKGDGAHNKVVQDKVDKDFKALDEDVKDIIDKSNLNLVTFKLISELIKSVVGIDEFVNKTIQDVNKSRISSGLVYEPGKAPVAEAQPVTKGSSKDGDIEKLEKRQQELINTNNALLSLLEYDDTVSDEITKNMKNSMFAGQVISLIASDAENMAEKIKESTQRRKKVEQKLKAGQRAMDLILGTYSGISFIDILIVMAAMFIVDIESLLGLLDEGSIERLRALKGNNNVAKPNTDVFESVSKLESRVTELFNTVQTQIDKNEHKFQVEDKKRKK